MSTPNFYDYTMSHVRLAILRLLVEAPLHQANDSILFTEAQRLGLPVTREQLRAQVVWLEEQGLIHLSRPTDALMVATVRERGGDVAIGRVFCDGVQRPSAKR